jgi:HSP20 family protein
MRALTPWTGIQTMKREMERLVDRFWDGDLPQLPSMGNWAPAMDVSETKDAVVVKAEVPGMESKDIQLSLQDQVLTLKGEKKEEKDDKDEHFYRMERSYGAFVRTVRLPATVDGSKVTATFKNGLLKVTLPKATTAKGTTPDCAALQPGDMATCRICRRGTVAVELGEAMISRATAAGGAVTMVDAHAGLAAVGGVAARLRFPL